MTAVRWVPAAPGEAPTETASRLALAGLMVGTGSLHFVVPRAYDRLIPRVLGQPRPWTLASGVAEIAAGALLGVPRTRRVGAWAVAAVLVGVFPANVDAAVRGGMPARGWLGSATAAWLRLPLQVPLVWWALRHRR